MKKKIKMIGENAANVKMLVGEIVKEQQKLDRHEGDVVACHIRIGHRLAELRVQAKKTWGKQLKTIGISPRVASRYLKIARHWPDQIGLNESDSLPRLPVDWLKLEWLCRVPPSQLPDLLSELDCKRATRAQVIAAVREVLGEDPPATPDCDVEQFVQRCIQRLAGTVAGLDDTFPEPKQQNRVRELLAIGLRQVLETLRKVLPSGE